MHAYIKIVPQIINCGHLVVLFRISSSFQINGYTKVTLN